MQTSKTSSETASAPPEKSAHYTPFQKKMLGFGNTAPYFQSEIFRIAEKTKSSPADIWQKWKHYASEGATSKTIPEFERLYFDTPIHIDEQEKISYWRDRAYKSEKHYSDLLAQRDELLAALKRTIAEWPGDGGAFPYLDAAIAAVEKGDK
ncbi:MAG TPA: hypothetical protein VFG51_00095 [Candidatus Saccharimonadia bacterium]|nr:hypothetical protein [Candidatus Saccharimonadia bacterium]